MSLDIKFTPLYGVHGAGPLSFLLQLGDFTILLDCGWTEPYDLQVLQPLRDVVDHVDAVLLSHPDLAHMGALPFLVGRLGLTAPVYATGAVHKMGQMCLYDAYLTRRAVSDFAAFDLDDVDAAFGRLTQLRYRQEVALTGRGAGVTVTPLAAGRLLGGAVWRVAAGGEEFVYSVDFNHRRERHLAGTALESAFLRPALLVADAGSVGRLPADRERCERALIDSCLSALRADGNVLIPMDAAGRVLEVALVLERHWGEHKLTYPVALVGPMAHTVLEFARSQLEWMNEALVRSFGHSKDNPFNLRYVRPCASLAELKRLPPGPKVVLATEPSLASGAARALFAEWAPDPRSAVLFLVEPHPGSLAATALGAAAEREARPGAPPPLLHVALSKRVPLSAGELEAYQKAEEERRAEASAAAAAAVAAGGWGDMAAVAGGAATGTPGGGSPRAHREAAAQPTRANSSAIGHLTRDSAGRGEVVAADGLPLAEAMDEDAEGPGACLVEGFQPPGGDAAPMFPAEDDWEGVEFDEYGEVADLVADGTGGEVAGGRLGRALATEAEAERGGEVEGGAVAGEADAELADAPTKVETKERAVALAARVVRIDFDGRSDGRSVQTMLAHVAPRNAFIVHGSPEATASLASHLERELTGLHAAVYAPAAGQTVEIAATPAFEVQLSDKLARGVKMHAVGGYDLAWVDGVVGPAGEEGGAAAADEKLEQQRDQGGSATVPMLLPSAAADDALMADDLPGSSGGGGGFSAEAQHAGVFIGDVRLSELKRALGKLGIASEFHGGALHCAGQVVVRRHGEGGGGLVLEGAVTDQFYRVREVVYAQYHVC